jgi:uncharacterized protein YndB with AHSA1/START domain
MKTHQFKVNINAPKEKVWQVLWEKSSYEKWTSAFAEGSTVETDGWKKGTKVLFGDGKGSGMVAEVADNIPNEFMSFRHLGEFKDGVEDTTSDKVKEWAGALENYRLTGEGASTELVVEIDVNDEWLAFFEQAWPKALQNIKTQAEQ